MRIISFNINGIRSIAKKQKNGQPVTDKELSSLESLIGEQRPDVLCFQEVKTHLQEHLEFLRPHFAHIYTNFAEKKGYSGTALLTNEEPQWVTYHFGEIGQDKTWAKEGRAITAKFRSSIVVTVYVPNSKQDLSRMGERMEWEAHLLQYLQTLEEHGVPIILCGDLNVAPQDIDIHRKQPKTAAGATKDEREAFTRFNQHYTDSFRHMHRDAREYSWWSNFGQCRDRNKGWRIDMVMVHSDHASKIEGAAILSTYKGSDHCPVRLDITLP
jgi:exodeoxyribonuclease-3